MGTMEADSPSVSPRFSCDPMASAFKASLAIRDKR